MSKPWVSESQVSTRDALILESSLGMAGSALGAEIIAVLCGDEQGVFLYFRDGAAKFALDVLQNANYALLRRLQEERMP